MDTISSNKKQLTFKIKRRCQKKPQKIQPKIQEVKIFNEPKKKKKIIKKRSGPSIYSKEYLEKKHGINIDRDNSNISKNKLGKKSTQSYFGFYSYLLILLFIVTTITGILHLTKEIVIFYFPFTQIYIENLFENLNNFGILFRDAFNLDLFSNSLILIKFLDKFILFFFISLKKFQAKTTIVLLLFFINFLLLIGIFTPGINLLCFNLLSSTIKSIWSEIP